MSILWRRSAERAYAERLESMTQSTDEFDSRKNGSPKKSLPNSTSRALLKLRLRVRDF